MSHYGGLTESKKTSATNAGPWGAEQQGRPDLSSVARLLKDEKTQNVVIMAGAGISTASGIPDFRSPDTGLYANLKKYNLPYPEAIFDIDYFHKKPQPFFTLSKELYPGNFMPTLTHTFFRLLDEKQKLLRVFTQNIDTLERLAGLRAERIVEAHGSFATSRCTRCKRTVNDRWMREKVMAGEIAHCPEKKCQRLSRDGRGGLVKPDIVFFGEGLPDRFFAKLGDLKQTDLLIILGTSLQVQPFAGLIDRVSPKCPRILINLERVGEIASYEGAGSSGLDKLLGGMRGLMNETGFDFEGWTVGKKGGKEQIRDVFWQGKCDEGISQLAKELGWSEELESMHKDVCAKLASGNKATEQADETLQQAEKKSESVAAEAAASATNESDSPSEPTDDGVQDLTGKLSKVDVNERASNESGAAHSKETMISSDARRTNDGKSGPSL